MGESFADSSKNSSGIGQQLEKLGCVYCGDFFSSSDLNQHVIKCSTPWTSTDTTEEKLVNPLNFIYDGHESGSSQLGQVPLEEAFGDVEEGDSPIFKNTNYQLPQEEPNPTKTENNVEQELVMESIKQDNTDSKKQKKVEIQSVVTINHEKPVYSKDNAMIVEEIYLEENDVKTLTVLNNATPSPASEQKFDPLISDTETEETPIKPSNTKLKTKKPKLVQIEPGRKLFQRIPSPVEEVTEKPGVFDFVDDDDNEDKRRKRQELRELKDRTCCTCSKIFSDPVAVLYHKRQEHYRKRIILDKLELQSYLLKPPKDHCPVCLKKLHHKKNVKTLYVKHLMTHANVLESSLKCKICERKFKRKDHLENHERRHF